MKQTCLSPVYLTNLLEILIRRRAWERPGLAKQHHDNTKGPLRGPARAWRKLGQCGRLGREALLKAWRVREAIKGK